MKLCFSNCICPDWPLERLIEVGRGAGYDGLLLHAVHGVFRGPAGELLARNPQAFRAQMAASGLSLCGLNSDLTLGDDKPAVQRALVSRLRELCHLTADAGARYLLVGADGSHVPASPGRLLSRAAETLLSVRPTAAATGVSLAVCSVGQLARSRDLWFLADAVGRDAIRIAWDPAEALRHGDAPSVVVPRLGLAIAIVLVSDGVAPNPAGEHPVCWPYVIELLKGLALDGWLAAAWPADRAAVFGPAEEALPRVANLLKAERDRAVVPLTAYKGDKTAPRFARRTG